MYHSPLPHMEYLHCTMHGTCWFTKLDFMANYHQSHIAIADRQQMASTVQFGFYKWQVLPFGLAYEPSQVRHLINSILEQMKYSFIVRYLDCIVIDSHLLREYVVHFWAVLIWLIEQAHKAAPVKYAGACQIVVFCDSDIAKNCITTPIYKI